jgi:hypothetical protein
MRRGVDYDLGVRQQHKQRNAKMTTTIKLMAKYKKLEAAAEAMTSNPNATSQDRRDSWAEANKVWEQIKATRKRAKK